MAFSIGAISANVKADDSGFNATMNDVHRRGERAASSVTKSFQKIGKQMRRTGTIMTAAVTAPVLAGMHKMTKEAALLEGAMDKFNVVFGDASDQMAMWVKEFREEVPLATAEIVKHAASMQDLLVPMGIARSEAQGMSKDWLELAAALSAFNDVPVQQALEAIRSGIAGMSRPLRQFGIDARQTALQQIALEEGLIGAGEAMDTQARQQALLIQAYRQSSDALDGYEDQQGSLLFIQQEVTASIKDLAASYGKVLVPVAKRVAQNISSIAKTLESFDRGTKKTIATVAGLAAAIGPAALGLGWAIKLTIPAAKTLTKVVKGLTAAMIKNPYLAVGAAIAFVAAKAIFARKKLNDLKESVDNVLQSNAATLEEVNKKIAQLGKEYKKAAENAENIPGMEAEDLIDPEIANQLQDLIKLQRKLSSEKLSLNIQMQALKDARKLMAFVNTDFSEITATSQQADISRPFVELKGVTDKIIPSLDQVKKGFQELSAQEIMKSPVTNVPEKMFPPGSLGFLQQSLTNLREQLRKATDPEVIKRLQEQIGLTEQQIEEFGSFAEQSGRNAAMAMGSLGNSIGGVIGQLIKGKEEALSFGNILASIAPALINVLTGGSGGFVSSLASGLFGGAFHSGGIVPGNGEKPILAKGGEGVFTKGQMQAMGGMMQSGGNMDTGKIQKAFERALGNKLQKLGPEEMYLLSRKGQHSF